MVHQSEETRRMKISKILRPLRLHWSVIRALNISSNDQADASRVEENSGSCNGVGYSILGPYVWWSTYGYFIGSWELLTKHQPDWPKLWIYSGCMLPLVWPLNVYTSAWMFSSWIPQQTRLMIYDSLNDLSDPWVWINTKSSSWAHKPFNPLLTARILPISGPKPPIPIHPCDMSFKFKNKVCCMSEWDFSSTLSCSKHWVPWKQEVEKMDGQSEHVLGGPPTLHLFLNHRTILSVAHPLQLRYFKGAYTNC